MRDTAVVTIAVDNVNEPPVFVSKDTFNIDENSPYGTVVGTVKAIDPENNNISYILQTSQTFPAFYIQADKIIVLNQDSVNYELYKQYKVIAVAQDQHYSRAYDTIIININDVNEAPVIEPNQFIYIDEHTPNGTIIDTLKTQTDEGESLSFSIESGNSNNAFAIDSIKGAISIANSDSLDPYHGTTLVIKATDNSSEHLSVQGDFTIYVNDVNDAPVILDQTYDFIRNRYHGGDIVAYIVATDKDSDPLSYSIIAGNEQSIFSIDQNTGILQVSNEDMLNNSDVTIFHLTIKVEDAEYADTAIITINLSPNSIINNNLEDIIDIYPNPVNDILYLNFRNISEDINIKIMDISSKVIYQKIFNSSGKINMTQFDKGLYFICVNYKEKNYLGKIILE